MPATFTPPIAPIRLPEHDSWPESRHRFDSESIWAVRAAIAARRPLLLRGEPGIGKSQLARAVAAVAQVPFLTHVVDERSERDDLLHHYDAVARLAEAQVSSLIAKEDKNWRARLAERNFVRPGVMWWAFSWDSAAEQAGIFSSHCRQCAEPKKPENWSQTSDNVCGPVVLVDEIDKADPSVPNGLLECLGNQGFQTALLGEPVRMPEAARHPLVIITTNEERELPAAFLRRCLVLQMRFPADQSAAEKFLLEERARVHWRPEQISDSVCKEVSALLWAERDAARRGGLAVPGAAEFLDLVRVLVELHPGDETAQKEALKQVSTFALRKNVDEAA